MSPAYVELVTVSGNFLSRSFTKQAAKTLRAMPPKTAKRILTAIEKLADNPARIDLDLKTLKGRDGCRLRVGDWRVIYSQDGITMS